MVSNKPYTEVKLDRRGAHAFAAALVLFLSINVCMAGLKPVAIDHFAYPIHTWSWWTLDSLRAKRDKTNIAVLGSSLTVSAISESDARFLGQNLDLSTYREARFLDQELTKRLGGPFRSVNLSAPGLMPSDAYLTLKAAIKLGHKPEAVIYGLAPRDFVDGTLSDATQTETFRVLERVVDSRENAVDLSGSQWTRLWHQLRSNVYLLSIAPDLQMSASTFLDTILSASGLQPPAGSASRWGWKERFFLMPTYHPMEMAPGLMFAEATPSSPPTEAPLDLISYKARYGNPDFVAYRKQLDYLEKVVRLSKAEGIALTLLNMPIRPCNMALLKPGLYARYLKDVKRIALVNDVRFFDMCKPEEYLSSDYRDSVHLNALGGTKFVKRLVETIAGDPLTLNNLTTAALRLKNNTVAGLETQAH